VPPPTEISAIRTAAWYPPSPNPGPQSKLLAPGAGQPDNGPLVGAPADGAPAPLTSMSKFKRRFSMEARRQRINELLALGYRGVVADTDVGPKLSSLPRRDGPLRHPGSRPSISPIMVGVDSTVIGRLRR